IGTLGQWMRKMKMASRLTIAQTMQKRMMPRQRRKVPPPPAGTTMYPVMRSSLSIQSMLEYFLNYS
uniref:Uncharacterized protein n=1 Tax=Echeneis naucrates TaxID=173247 RepID=A0A665VLK8_ECHNA